ncbi:hypothetical protein [Amycolatopsis balhimycina]|uniref:hypothetical protein n=1 Tax=Amycolatopsis balhimycina TaxID=208443 RepID=UPI0003A96548|nr:hypothetical protein [Amycolatopsis balhimycina]
MLLIDRANLGVDIPKGTKSTTRSLTPAATGALLAAADRATVTRPSTSPCAPRRWSGSGQDDRRDTIPRDQQ